jgi:hypothetical protein
MTSGAGATFPIPRNAKLTGNVSDQTKKPTPAMV